MEEINQENFDSVIEANHKVVVDFFTSGCRPCKLLAPLLEEAAQTFVDIKFVKIDAEENGDLSDELGISSVPTLVFFQDGQEADRYEGLLAKKALHDWLKVKE